MHYLGAVEAHLGGLSSADRHLALEALSAQLKELADAGIDPLEAIGDPVEYATELMDALADDSSPKGARWRFLGVPFETRGPVDAEVRARIWDPSNPRLFMPRLFGLGWSLNLGAVAVRAGLIRPDDTDDDVLDRIPERDLLVARAVPMVIAVATAAALAFVWSRLPAEVSSGFDAGGRSRGEASKWTLLAAVALGTGPAVWVQQKRVPVEDRLVRAASATSLATISAGIVAATVADARRPGGRWGLLVPASLPVAVAASLAVVVGPLRSGLRRAWQASKERP